jgi:hypothetical protein
MSILKRFEEPVPEYEEFDRIGAAFPVAGGRAADLLGQFMITAGSKRKNYRGTFVVT